MTTSQTIMATSKKRINVSLSKDVEKALYQLAKKDNVPPATKAASLIELAIEVSEDDVWDEIATKRDTKKTTFVSHKDAWK